MGKDMLNKLKEVFDQSKGKGMEHNETTEAQELAYQIAEDAYFESRLGNVVRESVDNTTETLENLLHRVLKTYKEPMINWPTFLGFFTKRGRLRDDEKLNLQLNKGRKSSASDLSNENES